MPILRALSEFPPLVALSPQKPARSRPTPPRGWGTGTPFSVKCPSGDLISTPAKRFFRRGHLLLKFDQSVRVQPKKEGDEGKIQPSRGLQISSILIAGGVGIGAKDLTGELAFAGFRSRYLIPISVGTLAFFSIGGDVLLKPAYKLEIEPSRY